MLAAREGNTKKVKFLLNHHASIEAKSHYNNTALLFACDVSYSKVVELLLKRGANKEARNNTDYTPLCLAASRGCCRSITILLSYGAEIDSRTGSTSGVTPLMLACANGHTGDNIFKIMFKNFSFLSKNKDKINF